ncbi:hypothetical protein K0M31_012683 [Melipona bicolor]|uniref:Uncharacterized protein n=1 Tax=Melipona bicolor TaxID=60889 RepID=A0AA40KH05_9HYME|nr:hypothetical protein K0M31_012683 [Melipona bicolor]
MNIITLYRFNNEQRINSSTAKHPDPIKVPTFEESSELRHFVSVHAEIGPSENSGTCRESRPRNRTLLE